MAHQSRWGWHPCDYATFLLLKRLNARYEKAVRLFAAWIRWQRKLPHNRVLRETLLDSRGRKIGRRVVGPRPEPRLDPLFCTRQKVVHHWSSAGKHLSEGETIERVAFTDHGISRAYRSARHPASAGELVAPLQLTPERIRELAGSLTA